MTEPTPEPTEPSPLRRKLDRALSVAQSMKEAQVATVRRRNPRRLWETDLRPLIEGWRGEEPVCSIITAEIDRDQALRAARAVIRGFGADSLVVITEGWHPAQEYTTTNPRTGRPWEHGQMQDLAEHHDALGRGWLIESLNVLAVNRAHDLAMGTQDYRVVQHEAPARLEIEWGELLSNDFHDAKVAGYVPASLARYMDEVPIDVLAARAGIVAEEFGVDDPEAVRAHLDCATVRSLPALGVEGSVMLLADEGSVRQSIIAQLRQEP